MMAYLQLMLIQIPGKVNKNHDKILVVNVHKKVQYQVICQKLIPSYTDSLLKDPENGCRICSHIEKFRSENSSLLGFHLWLHIFYVSPSRKLFPSLYLSIFEHNLEKQIAKNFCWTRISMSFITFSEFLQINKILPLPPGILH